jgi:hypothetical protein
MFLVRYVLKTLSDTTEQFLQFALVDLLYIPVFVL